MNAYTQYFLETLALLLALTVMAVVVVVVARKAGLGRSRGPIALAGHLPLDARRAIYLVEVGNQVLVVGAAEAGLTKLGEVEKSTLAFTPSEEPVRFRDVFRRLRGNRTDEPQ